MKITSTLARYSSDLSNYFKESFARREFDWQAAALTVALAQLAIARLVLTEWTKTLRTVETIGMIAVLLGFVIGYSSLKRFAVILAAVEYGLIAIPIQLLKETEATDSFIAGLSALTIRMISATNVFFNFEPVFDTLFFTALFSVIFWCIGIQAGYALARHADFLRITVPSGVAMLIVQIYDSASPLRLWALAFYILISLALLGRLYFLRNSERWKQTRVFSTPDSAWDIWRSILVPAAVIVFIAWSLPGALTRVEAASQMWEDFSRPFLDRFSDTVSPLESPYGSSGDGNPDFFGSNLGLGLNAPTSDTPAFFAQATTNGASPARFYWRGRTYDRYVNGLWTNSNVSQIEFNPETERLFVANQATRVETTVTFTMNLPQQKLLYAPAELAWLDIESQLTLAPSNAGERDTVAISASQNLTDGDSYEAISFISNPSIEELRAAGSEYPQWVTERYLQIPVLIEPELKNLADTIAGNAATPYDQAQAITDYLRNEITYVTEITDIPVNGEDPVLWLLFDSKKGFCMYSASAEVLLLRSIGIPARMVVGFAQGEYDVQSGSYIVERRDAHAWPEVYFPNIGWVEFEPTGNQNALARPLLPVENTASGDAPLLPVESEADVSIPEVQPPASEPEIAESGQSPSSSTNLVFQDLTSPILWIGFIAIVFWLNRRYTLINRLPLYLESHYKKNGDQPPGWLARWAEWARLTLIERAFHSINISLHWLKRPAPRYATPAERAQMLMALLPSAHDEIKALEHELDSSLFANRSGNLVRARRAGFRVLIEAWRARNSNFRDTFKRRI